jgi:hypothetical protein
VNAARRRAKAIALEKMRLEKGAPKACRGVVSPSRVRRRLFCARYGACLDYAVAKQWANFHCEDCRDYEDTSPTALDMCEWDMNRCRLLMGKCF